MESEKTRERSEVIYIDGQPVLRSFHEYMCAENKEPKKKPWWIRDENDRHYSNKGGHRERSQANDQRQGGHKEHWKKEKNKSN